MREISKRAYNAFMNRRKLNTENTKVYVDQNGDMVMTLFGNKIARTNNSEILISGGHYRPTATTRDRLSAFVDISIYKGDFIINKKHKWNGEWTNINNFS